MNQVKVISKKGALGETHSTNTMGIINPGLALPVLSKLVSKCDQDKIPDIYSTENLGAENTPVSFVVWFPSLVGQWVVTERCRKDPDLCFGYASIFPRSGELGYFRLSDIAEYSAQTGVSPVVEDWTRGKGSTLSEVRDEIEFLDDEVA